MPNCVMVVAVPNYIYAVLFMLGGDSNYFATKSDATISNYFERVQK